ncbi:hypothetical protein GXB85_10215 [Cellulomonas sp. APG4]|uniref:hypothetical protein n=1 Tax=Cellulomonas sp. APG4 TaxID=1538656 RepID=UPI00137A8394|nr:hypothetical protein [Cellulomonas sp. APG4]NCT91323.1 hypothetical protein [Cellulomonas sp. APG4]
MSRAVVLVLGRPSPDPADVAESVASLEAAGASVVVLTHDPLELDHAPVHVLGDRPQQRSSAPRPVRLARLALRIALRRTAAATLARAAQRDPAARDALDSAAVVVAGDAAAIETVWRAARRLPASTPAVTGVPAALRALRDLPA